MNPTRPTQTSPIAPSGEQGQDRAAKLTEPRPLPTPGVDATGRALPCTETESERKARIELLLRELAAIDAEDDTPDELYEQFFRNMDEERRREGRPPAFEGLGLY
jgi:hypothetical protein